MSAVSRNAGYSGGGADVHLVVRLNDLDLTRATEQTAIVSSLALGKGYETRESTPKTASKKAHLPRALRGPTAEHMAIDSLLGYLKESYCQVKIVDTCPHEWEARWPATSDRLGQIAGRGLLQYHWQLDVVAGPVDGIRDLLQGFDGGSIAVLAGGPMGCFDRAMQRTEQAEYYFVIAVPPSRDADAPLLQGKLGGAETEPLEESLSKAKVWEAIERRSGKGPSGVTINTMWRNQPAEMLRFLSGHNRLRVFQGSSVGAALAAVFPTFGVDAFAAIVHRAHVIMMATGSLATGGEIYAVPVTLKKRKGKREESAFVEPGTEVLRSEDLTRDDDMFLIATGITESPVLRGVRFRGESTVSTHTICLRSHTKSKRFVTHHHNLDEKVFRMLDSAGEVEGMSYDAVVGRFDAGRRRA